MGKSLWGWQTSGPSGSCTAHNPSSKANCYSLRHSKPLELFNNDHHGLYHSGTTEFELARNRICIAQGWARIWPAVEPRRASGVPRPSTGSNSSDTLNLHIFSGLVPNEMPARFMVLRYIRGYEVASVSCQRLSFV